MNQGSANSPKVAKGRQWEILKAGAPWGRGTLCPNLTLRRGGCEAQTPTLDRKRPLVAVWMTWRKIKRTTQATVLNTQALDPGRGKERRHL